MIHFKEDAWILRRIFELSDCALLHMLNRLFCTEYVEGECIQKEWYEQGVRVCLTVGCANRYEFQIRHLDGCLEICAEDRMSVSLCRCKGAFSRADSGTQDDLFWEKHKKRVLHDA